MTFLQPVVEVVKPANQLQLDEKQLNEEFARSLNAGRPGPARVVVWYNLEEKCFKPETQLEQVMVHYSNSGVLLQKESEEGQRELLLQAQEAEASALTKVRPAKLHSLIMCLHGLGGRR